MKVVVFTGPTLPAAEVLSILDARDTLVLPPVAQGDVYRAALGGPHAIAIIDGFFEREPAVWHKEILWALSRGVHVFGAASMGALRAAELSAYGMVGVGAIFEALANGTIEDDDEVAVAHGDADSGYRALSEALVNIRFTLEKAVADAAIDEGTSRVLLEIARGHDYPARSWPALFAAARERGVASPIVESIERFVARGRIDRKRLDALAMLAQIRAHLDAAPGPKRVAFAFEHTDAWDQVVRRAGRDGVTGATGRASDATFADRLAEEARLDGDRFTAVHRGALLRALAEDEMRRQGAGLDGARTEEAKAALVTANEGGRDRFLVDNDLDARGLDALAASEARLLWLETMREPDTLRHLPDELRAAGRYPALAARARDKERLLAPRGLADPTLADVASLVAADAGTVAPGDEAALLRWYFEARLGRPLPASAAARLRALALPDEDALRREALREYLYLHLAKR